jgi:beta-glucosidase/6-phospho-beta-glucosidase/beta-galactosidase
MSEPYEELRTNLASILIDPLRSAYYRDYLSAILLALSEGVNVVGTLAWSIYDNLEWSQGYSVKFGIQVCCSLSSVERWRGKNTANFAQYVNLTTQERYFKASAFEYVNMFNVYQEK